MTQLVLTHNKSSDLTRVLVRVRVQVSGHLDTNSSASLELQVVNAKIHQCISDDDQKIKQALIKFAYHKSLL